MQSPGSTATFDITASNSAPPATIPRAPALPPAPQTLASQVRKELQKWDFQYREYGSPKYLVHVLGANEEHPVYKGSDAKLLETFSAAAKNLDFTVCTATVQVTSKFRAEFTGKVCGCETARSVYFHPVGVPCTKKERKDWKKYQAKECSLAVYTLSGVEQFKACSRDEQGDLLLEGEGAPLEVDGDWRVGENLCLSPLSQLSFQDNGRKLITVSVCNLLMLSEAC